MMWIVSTDGRQESQGQTYWSDLSLSPTKYLINIDQPDVSMSHIILRAEQEPLRLADNKKSVMRVDILWIIILKICSFLFLQL